MGIPERSEKDDLSLSLWAPYDHRSQKIDNFVHQDEKIHEFDKFKAIIKEIIHDLEIQVYNFFKDFLPKA